jgi:hypothetical protein
MSPLRRIVSVCALWYSSASQRQLELLQQPTSPVLLQPAVWQRLVWLVLVRLAPVRLAPVRLAPVPQPREQRPRLLRWLRP